MDVNWCVQVLHAGALLCVCVTSHDLVDEKSWLIVKSFSVQG